MYRGPMKRIGMTGVLAGVASAAVSADDTARRPPAPSKPRPTGPVTVTLESKKALTVSSLGPGALAAKIEAGYVGAIRRCYEEQIARTPRAEGTLVLRFQVTTRGDTSAVRASSSASLELELMLVPD